MTILGLTWLRGPCTVYAVMKELAASESTYYRSRAGTAYSVVARLVKFGFVHQAEDNSITITEAGREVLQNWVGPEIEMGDIAHTVDWIRLRFFFLECLSPADRLALIDRCQEGLAEFEQRCLNLIQVNQELGEYFGALATVNIVMETRARMQWLRLIRPFIENPLPADADWTRALIEAMEKDAPPG
ncbi:MAG: PadR family transcriptional regulator [Fimbriimonadaceae bacterium]